jgi:hypothetical protein
VRRLLALLIPRCVREGGSRRGLLGQRQTGRLPRTPPSPVSPGRRLLPKRGGGVPSRTAARRAEGCSALTRPRASPRTSAASPWSERAASRRCAEASPRTGAPRHPLGQPEARRQAEPAARPAGSPTTPPSAPACWATAASEALLSSRRTQTNAPGRCAALLPALASRPGRSRSRGRRRRRALPAARPLRLRLPRSAQAQGVIACDFLTVDTSVSR